MKILMAVDGSEYTRRMVRFVESHDALFPPGTEFTVVTVVLPLPGRAAAFLSQLSIDTYYQNAADEVFMTVRHFVNERVEVAPAPAGGRFLVVEEVPEAGRQFVL